MKLHNTLNRDQPITQFTPIEKGKVRMYSCGPTVYDNIHIGNLRAFIVADVLRRTLTAQGLDVEHVMNFTDVDDKTIRRSAERYPDEQPLRALQLLTEEYEQIFVEDMDAIGNDIEAVEFVRATESIDAMQELIRNLHKAGFAYTTDDGVYFSIQAYQKSGKTYGQLLKLNAENTSESRIDNDEYDKESVHDFALWKTQKGGEPAWNFEIDGQDLKGRPGWHIECSAMSSKLLGQPFDIHTGGVDLIFPHHENEIAQSTALNDDGYANCFVHNEHLLVDGKKMSKSLENFYTLRNVQDKGFDPLAFRLLVLQSHYQKQMNFSWESLTAAQTLLTKWRNHAIMRYQSLDAEPQQGYTAASFKEARESILQVMSDNLGTPFAVSLINKELEKVSEYLMKDAKDEFVALLEYIDAVFGLDLSTQENITDEQSALLDERKQHYQAKNFEKSDSLRDELKAQGISVRDTNHGQIWSRV
jgi:cysteinyl-tRNA synthetase